MSRLFSILLLFCFLEVASADSSDGESAVARCKEQYANQKRPTGFVSCGRMPYPAGGVRVKNMSGNKIEDLSATALIMRLTEMENVTFNEVNISELMLIDVQMMNSHFDKAWVTGFKPLRANLLGTEFKDSNLNGTKCLESSFKEVTFINTTLDQSVFEYCNLENVKFKGASLKRVMFFSSPLKGATYDSKTVLPFSDEVAAKKGMIKID